MKALVYTAPRTLEIRDLPQPQITVNEALIKIRAVGVCGSDVFGYLGRSKRRIPPLVLGHEFSGQVAEAGADVRDFRPGDPVAVYPLVTCGTCEYCRSNRHHICPQRKVYSLDFHGALAEYVAAPRECLFHMPPDMSFIEGSLIEPLANAIHVIEKCPPVAGRSGVIFGVGSIGLLAFWYARHRGAERMAVVDLNPRRLAVLQQMGADLVIDASRQDPVKTLLEWTGGRGVDFSIDAVGNQPCRRNAIACTAPGGTSGWIGLDEDTCELSGLVIVNREIEIKGSYAYSRSDFAAALSLLERKLVRTDQFVRTVKLDQGPAVFAELASSQTSMIKAVFELG